MTKWLLLLVLLAVVWFVAKPVGSVLKKRSGARADRARPAESVVACHVCGLNVPKSEAFLQGQKFYCSTEHRDRRE